MAEDAEQQSKEYQLKEPHTYKIIRCACEPEVEADAPAPAGGRGRVPKCNASS